MDAREFFYALQRMVAEAVLALMVLEAGLRDRAGISCSNCFEKVNQNVSIDLINSDTPKPEQK
jgi:hypothetical protein